MKNDLFISVDIETDGPIPLRNSLLSIGAAAIDDLTIIDSFSVNLEQLPEASVDPKTKKGFWDRFPEAWEACRQNLVPPKQGMEEFANWVQDVSKRTNKKPTFVGYPAGFDFTFVYVYLIEFLGKSLFSFSALDMKSLAMSLLHKKGSGKFSYKSASKRRMPKEWFSKRPHTHIAVDDALEQADLLISMLKELDKE